MTFLNRDNDFAYGTAGFDLQMGIRHLFKREAFGHVRILYAVFEHLFQSAHIFAAGLDEDKLQCDIKCVRFSL